jgi:phytoene dehydrogenase-like protein
MADETNRVVVVGAGLAGLTAAATAARTGAHVTVLEAREHDGGRARTQTVMGFLLNQGAHALYRGGPAWEILHDFGIAPRGRPPAADCAWGLRADGRFGVIPTTPRTLLRSPLVGARAKFELARLFARPAKLPETVESGTSMQQWIDRQVRSADARAFVAMGSRVATYCGDLDGLDAQAGVQQLVRALTSGVLYLDSGWQQLVDGLRAVALTAGVSVESETKVDAVDVHGDAVTVRTRRGEIAADAVVIANGGPRDVDSLLRGASAAVRTWAATERPVAATTLDVALDALPVPARRITFGLDEPMYLSVHTPYAQLAPPKGGDVVHLLWYGESATDPRPLLEALFERAQPGWRAHVVAERYGRRLVVTHGRPEPGRGTAGRPPALVPDLPRVLVAGDWVGPDGMLADAAFASGRAAGLAATRGARATVHA